MAAVDLTGDGGVLKTVLRAAAADAARPDDCASCAEGALPACCTHTLLPTLADVVICFAHCVCAVRYEGRLADGSVFDRCASQREAVHTAPSRC